MTMWTASHGYRGPRWSARDLSDHPRSVVQYAAWQSVGLRKNLLGMVCIESNDLKTIRIFHSPSYDPLNPTDC